jgi:lipopolysaccharide/colanic/teichoic acid biosynthesis glycosyltransferase
MATAWRPKEQIRSGNGALTIPPPAKSPALIDQQAFVNVLHIEQKRTERSGRKFILVLIDCDRLLAGREADRAIVEKLKTTVSVASRETDIRGWYRDGSQLGLIFTEIDPANIKAASETIWAKVKTALSETLTEDQLNGVAISLHIFPDDWHDGDSGGPSIARHKRDVVRDVPARSSLLAKRTLDIVGSLIALLLLSPLFILLFVVVRLTSRGPAIFRQRRIGLHGRPFTMLKFRSMYRDNNSAVHQQFVQSLIAGANESATAHGSHGQMRRTTVFKITDDKRVTPVGRFLRRTSLDELPQFLNVLLGDMSLVGPRPPVRYEVDRYKVWHGQRLLSLKPGLTGLWQVKGRSRVNFDDMVRLDLAYARDWSIWLDIKILLETPKAVFSGGGAF